MGFRIDYFCPRWGSEELIWPVFLKQVKAAGFDGVEWAIPGDASFKLIDQVFDLADREGLALIAQHYDTNDGDFDLHYDHYLKWLDLVRVFPWRKINSQTGKDYFTLEENRKLIALAGKDVVHETHRGKFSFAAHVTRAYLLVLPELRLTLDASHWCNVAESYLDDQVDAVDLAIGRTDHIHARVGYPEGPQVGDPMAPEWQMALDVHLGWWDQVVKLKRAAGEVLTITPEFGPYPYMVEMPFTREPVASQWGINVSMMNLLKKRYGI